MTNSPWRFSLDLRPDWVIDCSFGFGNVDCLCYDCAIEFGLVGVKVT
jgi:hypothetical protein